MRKGIGTKFDPDIMEIFESDLLAPVDDKDDEDDIDVDIE